MPKLSFVNYVVLEEKAMWVHYISVYSRRRASTVGNTFTIWKYPDTCIYNIQVSEVCVCCWLTKCKRKFNARGAWLMARGVRLFGQFARFAEYLKVGAIVWMLMSKCVCGRCVNCWLWFWKLPNTVCVVLGCLFSKPLFYVSAALNNSVNDVEASN